MSIPPELDNWYVHEQSIIKNIRKRYRDKRKNKEQ